MSGTPPRPLSGSHVADSDEFEALAQARDELGLTPAALPLVSRHSVALEGSQQISALVWGPGEPEMVFLHGGGQNAHTWDLLLLLLHRPAIAIDLPGHGHSTWRADRDYSPIRSAIAVAAVIEELAPKTDGVIGMSIGALTTIHLAAHRRDLVQRAVLIDGTPGSAKAASAMTAQQRGPVELTRGPRTFASREEMVNAAVAASPKRPATAVRRGVIHNSRQLPDGTWAWRYDRGDSQRPFPTEALWDDASQMTMPTLLVTGAESGFVTAADQAEMSRRVPHIRIETVAGAGHAVQSDQPRALADLITDFLPPADNR